MIMAETNGFWEFLGLVKERKTEVKKILAQGSQLDSMKAKTTIVVSVEDGWTRMDGLSTVSRKG